MPRINVKDKRKQQLIAATVDSIAKRGLSETTITHISKGAGMSRGIINFYFTSKETMLRETLMALIEEYEAAWMPPVEAVKANPAVALDALIDAHFSKKLCNAKRLNVLSAFWGHAATHAAYRIMLENSDAKLLKTIRELWASCAPQGMAADQVARQLHALIRGLWLSFLLSPAATERESLARECRAFLESQRGKPAPAVKPRVVSTKPTGSPPALTKKPKARDVLEGQMDIEDLFAAR